MKRSLPILLGMLFVVSALLPTNGYAQGNIDWEELWVVMQPTSSSHPTYGWMAGQRQYTGLAYDKTRDNLYIVNPGICSISGNSVGCPRIHIWDPLTGLPKTTEGRIAAQFGQTPGKGGQLPVPPDTIAGVLQWVYPGSYTSFGQGQFPIYKVDVDDEEPARIFASNLVAPIWGICFPGPPPNCRPEYLGQGPFRVWRWDTPKSTPRLVYVTLNLASTGPGTLGDSEMQWTRWGDAFDVVGKRGYVDTPQGPKLVDSVRIFTSGGPFDGQSQTNDQINVVLTDDRQVRPVTDKGLPLEYRLGIRMMSSLEGLASHGIAATGPQSFAEVWHDNNNRVTTINNQFQTNAPFPQNMNMTLMNALSSDPFTGTGPAGPLAFFKIKENGNAFLVVCDGFPTDPSNPTAANSNTRARIMNVTTTGQEAREPGFGDTPYLGQKIQTNNSGIYNYIADVDVKLEPDFTEGKGYFVHLFVLQSNNGIACYRSRIPIVPVELSTFKAERNGMNIDLRWEVTIEVNNYGFQIDRSFNGGGTWETIGFVRGRGTTKTPTAYTHSDPVTDIHSSVGHVQYRLRQVDTDGKTTVSPVVDVYMNGAANGIELSQNYPNPFNPTTSISYQLQKPGYVTLKVFNPIGEEIGTLVNEAKDAGVHMVTFNAADLTSGTYVYQINVDGQILQKKMVLMK